MLRRRTYRTVAALAALTIVAAGCGGDDDDAAVDTTTAAVDAEAGGTDTTAGGDEEEASGDGPRFIYITPTPIGVNRFLELGQIGSERAAETLGGTADTFESTDLNSRRANLEAAIEEAPDVIVLTTFEFTELSKEFADANPEQEFILIDACPEEAPANLHCGVFREHEGAYLLGIMAGRLTETNQIGSVVALDIPFLHRWSDGFAAGALSVNPDVTDSQVYIGGDNAFSDPARAKEQALALAAQGADHIFAVGAGSNGGVFEAAVEQEFLSYGVDVNQCPDAADHIVDNNLKLVDNVVESLLNGIMEGSAETLNSFGLAEEGTGVIALRDDLAASECVIADHPDIVAEVVAAADQIIAGDLVVEDPLTAGA